MMIHIIGTTPLDIWSVQVWTCCIQNLFLKNKPIFLSALCLFNSNHLTCMWDAGVMVVKLLLFHFCLLHFSLQPRESKRWLKNLQTSPSTGLQIVSFKLVFTNRKGGPCKLYWHKIVNWDIKDVSWQLTNKPECVKPCVPLAVAAAAVVGAAESVAHSPVFSSPVPPAPVASVPSSSWSETRGPW